MSVNAALHEFEFGAPECWSCGLGGRHPGIPEGTQTRVVRGVRVDLCDRCAELCDESSEAKR